MPKRTSGPAWQGLSLCKNHEKATKPQKCTNAMQTRQKPNGSMQNTQNYHKTYQNRPVTKPVVRGLGKWREKQVGEGGARDEPKRAWRWLGAPRWNWFCEPKHGKKYFSRCLLMNFLAVALVCMRLSHIGPMVFCSPNFSALIACNAS